MASETQTNGHSVENSHNHDYYFLKTKCKAIDLEWENVTINATKVQRKAIPGTRRSKKIKETKTILDNVSGTLRHGEFTAIMGPSGSGKTVLLNYLCGRSDARLDIRGILKVNKRVVQDIEPYANLMAFVQQDDILMATLTPRELFTFNAKLRLNISKKEKKERVEALIHDLGLQSCANTRVGNNLIRGVSGGERKRTSIGVELITNPSLIFLDEPTTGLDSKTALIIVNLLKELAKSGRNVIATIHQPSSDVFAEFDKLMLIVRGKIVYQGDALAAVQYFASIGFPCPTYANPADHFMKILNESGLIMQNIEEGQEDIRMSSLEISAVEAKFAKRVEHLVESYQKSNQIAINKANVTSDPIENVHKYEVSWFTQFFLILGRAFRDIGRNPIDLQMKVFESAVYAALAMIIFANIPDDFTGIQARYGILFWYSGVPGFVGVQNSMATFNMERPVFIRERLAKQYRTSAYFWAKSTSEIPMMILMPILIILPSYYVVGLQPSFGKVAILLAITILAFFAGTGYGLLISTLFAKIEIAQAMVPVLIVPMFLLAGFFVKHDQIPVYLWPIEYISIFKWAWQGAVLNEFDGLELTCSPECDPGFTFDNNLATSFAMLGGIGVAVRILAYWGLVKISTPKKAVIKRPDAAQQAELKNNQDQLQESESRNHQVPEAEIPRDKGPDSEVRNLVA